MYVDVATNYGCVLLEFDNAAAGGSWSIKVTQYHCDYENLAPNGCVEYYFTGSSGVVKTYNYDGRQSDHQTLA